MHLWLLICFPLCFTYSKVAKVFPHTLHAHNFITPWYNQVYQCFLSSQIFAKDSSSIFVSKLSSHTSQTNIFHIDHMPSSFSKLQYDNFWPFESHPHWYHRNMVWLKNSCSFQIVLNTCKVPPWPCCKIIVFLEGIWTFCTTWDALMLEALCKFTA